MKDSHSKSVTVLITLTVCFIMALLFYRRHPAVWSHITVTPDHPAVIAHSSQLAVPEFDGYRTWKKINLEPQTVKPELLARCVGPITPNDYIEHPPLRTRMYMLCYVNPVGQHAMLEERTPHFPVGSVVVKEQLDARDPNANRTLLTGMVKHEAGYDPVHGDWEYIVASGDASKLQARGKLANCGGCHELKRANDYVFRDEMGEKRLLQLMAPGTFRPELR